MRELNLQKTKKTPEIRFDPSIGTLFIQGRSIPENSIEFYAPVFDWLNQYISTTQKGIVLDVRLEYFNTSSSKCMVEIFRKLEALYERGLKVEVNWYYESDDEDMEESAEDFQQIVSVPIIMHPTK